MSDEAGLLDAIREDQDSDTPRLVYADWLDDHGEVERAEFIRLQCELARLPAEAPERRQKYNRASVLLEQHRPSWFGALDKEFTDCVVERGFVSRLRAGVDAFLAHHQAVERYAPVLQSAAMRYVGVDAARVLALPFARSVRRLSMDGVFATSLDDLGQFKLPANITDLTLFIRHSSTHTDVFPFLAPFLDGPVVRLPQRLGLAFSFFPENHEGDEVEYAVPLNLRLLEGLDLPNLRGFGTWGINDPVAEAIAAWPGLSRIDELLFGLTWIEDSALPIILASPLLRDIDKAFFDENFLGDNAAVAIAACPKFASTTYLNLSENNIHDAGAAALAESPWLTRLDYFSLWGNNVSKAVAARLRERFGEAFQPTASWFLPDRRV
jgi:uncharacterized protein (TIGR02996 family)